MRIAVTGTHGSGKTTLIDDFVEAHPDHEREHEIQTRIEFPRLRQQVDTRLKSIIRDDALELLGQSPKVLELRGSRAERVRMLSRAVGR